MSQGEIARLIQDAVYTVLTAAAPMLISAMVVGLVVSIFQATTQINEQTLSFVPKIVVAFLMLVFLWGFISNSVGAFTRRMFEYMVTMPG